MDIDFTVGISEPESGKIRTFFPSIAVIPAGKCGPSRCFPNILIFLTVCDRIFRSKVFLFTAGNCNMGKSQSRVVVTVVIVEINGSAVDSGSVVRKGGVTQCQRLGAVAGLVNVKRTPVIGGRVVPENQTGPGCPCQSLAVHRGLIIQIQRPAVIRAVGVKDNLNISFDCKSPQCQIGIIIVGSKVNGSAVIRGTVVGKVDLVSTSCIIPEGHSATGIDGSAAGRGTVVIEGTVCKDKRSCICAVVRRIFQIDGSPVHRTVAGSGILCKTELSIAQIHLHSVSNVHGSAAGCGAVAGEGQFPFIGKCTSTVQVEGTPVGGMVVPEGNLCVFFNSQRRAAAVIRVVQIDGTPIGGSGISGIRTVAGEENIFAIQCHVLSIHSPTVGGSIGVKSDIIQNGDIGRRFGRVAIRIDSSPLIASTVGGEVRVFHRHCVVVTGNSTSVNDGTVAAENGIFYRYLTYISIENATVIGSVPGETGAAGNTHLTVASYPDHSPVIGSTVGGIRTADHGNPSGMFAFHIEESAFTGTVAAGCYIVECDRVRRLIYIDGTPVGGGSVGSKDRIGKGKSAP